MRLSHRWWISEFARIEISRSSKSRAEGRFPIDEFATAREVVLVAGGADLGHGSGQNVRAGRPKGVDSGFTREFAEFYSDAELQLQRVAARFRSQIA